MRVGESTWSAATVTPDPATASVLGARKPVLEPVSSTSSDVPRGSTDG